MPFYESLHQSISNLSLKWGLTCLLAVVTPVFGLVALLTMGGTFLKHVVAVEKQSSLPLVLTFLMLYGLIMITILHKSQFIYCTTF
jgi:hypothetical protein